MNLVICVAESLWVLFEIVKQCHPNSSAFVWLSRGVALIPGKLSGSLGKGFWQL